ncbi:hypothetical protein [Chryseobacterium sp.]|uniref:hypothetical protein n=1 Tax=Chryseobacterium sp. TaxID=1871047 RepID=UPI00289D7037|nr:hypothetical protein [Chryseobacterium sp.]
MESTVLSGFQSLLFGMENPGGNIEQVMFANKMALSEGISNCNRLARLNFENPNINRAFSGEVAFDETLLIGYEGWSDCVLHLCIRIGLQAIKIATGSFPSWQVTFYDDYKKAVMVGKLLEEEIREVFSFVWGNYVFDTA